MGIILRLLFYTYLSCRICFIFSGTFEKLLCGILSKGVCVNAKDYEGNTVLHLAVNVIDKLHDAENLILKLLKNGCNINAVDNAEMTPLGRICQKGHRTSREFSCSV